VTADEKFVKKEAGLAEDVEEIYVTGPPHMEVSMLV